MAENVGPFCQYHTIRRFNLLPGSIPCNDSTIGLYDYNARFYDPQLGQFTQPDSLVAEPLNPIAWNRYAYVYNSPVNYTDSTGHFIDTLWDLYDLGADVAGCLGDSDALACYMIPLDALALAVPGVPGVADNALKAGRHLDEVSLVRQADSCAFNSFTAGTLVQTEQGLVPIEQIKLGDRVLAQDPETGETGYFEVVDLTNHPTTDILRITVDDDGRDHLAAEVMEITPEHPVYVEDKGWVLAENLATGDRLRRADGGWARVLAVEQVRLETPEMVYNFTVKGVHTYFVLEVGVLVHNAKACVTSLKGPFGRLEINKRQKAFYEKHYIAETDPNTWVPTGKKKPFDETDWNNGNCQRYSSFFCSKFGDRQKAFSKYGYDEVLVDYEVVGSAHGGSHYVAVDKSGRVWDPSTDTWGQNLDDYLKRVSYRNPSTREIVPHIE